MTSQEGNGTSSKFTEMLALAQQNSTADREELLSRLWESYEAFGANFNDREKSLASEIFCQLTAEATRGLRKELSKRLTYISHSPPKLVKLLAGDEIDIALPLLCNSEFLNDSDLVEIIYHSTLQHRMAIAARSDLGEETCQALVDQGEEEVISRLLNNHDAKISPPLMETLVDLSKEVANYQAPLLKRPDLPPRLARHMYDWVGESLRTYIIANYPIDPHQLDQELDKAKEKAIQDSAPDEATRDSAFKLIEKLHLAGELTPGFMVKTLRQGKTTLFELTFAKLTSLPPTLIRRIIYDPTPENLAIACKAIDLDPLVFRGIQEMTRKALALPVTGNEPDMRSLLAFYDSLSVEDAQRTLRNSNFLSSLKTVR